MENLINIHDEILKAVDSIEEAYRSIEKLGVKNVSDEDVEFMACLPDLPRKVLAMFFSELVRNK